MSLPAAPQPILQRRAVVRQLLHHRGTMIVVAGLGSTAWDLAATGDHPLDFPLWGAMGGAAMVGLGLALAQPARTVLVLTGDGELLMGLGSLATIGVQKPANLAIVVFDNGLYVATAHHLRASRAVHPREVLGGLLFRAGLPGARPAGPGRHGGAHRHRER
jgi:thiamine pyrophosphate-dependent acetolactate synthase large subunit-like protein